MVSHLVDEDAGNRTSEEEIVSGSEGPANLTALDSVSRSKDSSEVPGFQLERVLS